LSKKIEVPKINQVIVQYNGNEKAFDFFMESMINEFQATSHRGCAKDTKSDFSPDCTEIPQAYFRMSRDFCAKWRKICK
jgi:hypothetical protein